MSKYLDENGLLYLWEKITDAIDPKADKVPEVNHGTSDTTFTLTPNIMHIWGEIATLNLTLSADSNSVLDEYMFTFTCPSTAATTLTLLHQLNGYRNQNYRQVRHIRCLQ